MRFYAHLLVLVAFVLAGISPACQFVSGSAQAGMQEICTLAGIKLLPNNPATPDAPDLPTQQTLKDCPFCFARDHQPALDLAQVIIPVPVYVTVGVRTHVPRSIVTESIAASFQPRGPPVV